MAKLLGAWASRQPLEYPAERQATRSASAGPGGSNVLRFDEQEKRFRMFLAEQIADLDRRITVRMLVGIGAVSALVKLL